MAKKVTLPLAGQRAMQRSQRKAGMTTRAWTATRKLNAMLPMLERYARAVLQDPKVKVQATHQASYTDGKNIFIQPPMMLGDNNVHMVGSCGARGDDKRLVCPACDADELVMSLLYHEVSHMAFGSFVTPEKLGRKALAGLVVEWHPPQACDHGVDILEAMAKSEVYLAMAHHFDERLPLAMNGLEDARVNSSMLGVRPGTRVMLDARMHYIFSNDLELASGETRVWNEMPIDGQVSIGMLLAASGYFEHFEAFHEDARTILADEVLMDLARKIGKAKDVHELTVHTADVWRRFQDLGIMVKEKCVPPPPEDDSDSEDQDDADQDQDEDQEPQPDEDAGEQPDLGSLGNEGQPSPSDGDGEGGSSGDSDKDDDKKESDGADSSGDQRQSDPTASSGPGSSSAPGKGSGEDQRESGMSNVPEQSSDEEGSGGGDRVQDERDSGSEDDLSSGESSGSDSDSGGQDADGHDADGGDSTDPNPDGSEGDAGGELTDGKTSGQKSEGEGDEGDSDEPSDAEHQGGTSDGSADEHPGEDAGTGGGPGGGGPGGEADGDAEEAGVRDGGPDEDDESDPANFTPATLEELTAVIQAGSLHKLFEDENTDVFASGSSVLNEDHDQAMKDLWVAALLIAGMQAAWFEGPSEEVGKVQIIQYGENNGVAGFNKANVRSMDLMPPQTVVGPVVTKGRPAFSPNKRNRFENGLKSGKINPRALRRIPGGAEDLFRKKHVAAKRSYHVIITVDVSGSTSSEAPSEHFPNQTTNEMMLRSVFAQAEALSRLNISFEVWAHTADWFLTQEERVNHFANGKSWGSMPKMDIWLLQVKQPGDKWDADARERMHALRPLGGNLDGHTLQIMRKRADEMKRKFTDVIICYYTDGAMPASNAREEGRILKEETALCKRKGYPLLAVAAGTDSPKAWGFDTVQIDSDADLPKVMEQLERAIL